MRNTIEDNINKNNSRFQQPQQKKGCSCSLNGCAWIILFSILMGICINECKSSKLKLEREKQLQEQYQKIQNDSLLNIKNINTKLK